ncbi:hypothetical protein NBH15_01240 [Parabacteroides sp. W1-Q-101]|nr:MULTISPECIES: hypothetical protein [Parabacteroides]MCM0716893.1 hypothetical protein [Parabacteroides sp. W1-Q-101]
MNTKFITSFTVIILIISSIIGCTETQKPVQLELRSSPWNFTTQDAPLNILTQQNTKNNFVSPGDRSSFTIKLQVNLTKVTSKKSLLTIPGVLELNTYQNDPEDRKQQNYPAYPMADGSVPVLEASLLLHLPVQPEEARYMPVGIPLAMLDKPEGGHEIVLHFSGVRWTMYVDNELLDNDFPLGYPQWG